MESVTNMILDNAIFEMDRHSEHRQYVKPMYPINPFHLSTSSGCGKMSPSHLWICNREPGHTGLHEAYISDAPYADEFHPSIVARWPQNNNGI